MKYLKIGHNHWENDAYTKHICGPWYLGPYYTCLFTNTKQCNKYGGIFKSFLDKFSSPCQSGFFPKLLTTPKYVKGAPVLWPLHGGKTGMGKHLDSPSHPLKKKRIRKVQVPFSGVQPQGNHTTSVSLCLKYKAMWGNIEQSWYHRLTSSNVYVKAQNKHTHYSV